MAQFAPPSFLDLPTEIKLIILGKLDGKSLVRMRMTSKSIFELIYASHECNLVLEMAKSELVPVADVGTSAIARRAQVHAHLTSRLTLPLETRHCDLIDAPDEEIIIERLFQGLFVCKTDITLHVWDIRSPGNPTKVLMFSDAHLLDAVISMHFNLLILLCHYPNGTATIKLSTLNSRGQQVHPSARSPLIIIPERVMNLATTHRQFLTLHGPLLSLVYSKGQDRRGIVWDWRTGDRLYDSMEFDSTSKFHDLRLLTLSGFLVAACTPSINGPPTNFRAWIELRQRGSSGASRLIAELNLPEFDKGAEFDLEALEFLSSEPQNQIACSNAFPFVSDMRTHVHVLHIWYRSRPESITRESSRAYLVISDKIFGVFLEFNVPETSVHLRIGWDDWGPPWTSMWDYSDLGILSGFSSVCGSRICSVSHPADGCIELLVVDFNTNIPCAQRNCDPLVHFSPKLFRSSEARSHLWARVVHTWLPFHVQRKRITIPKEEDDDDEDWEMCTTVLMDEERIVFSTCESESPMLDPTCWRIIHVLRDGQNSAQNVLPWTEDIDVIVSREPMQRDVICRLCREKPHTDCHILLECTAHPNVVQLRQNTIRYIGHHFPALYNAWCRGSFGELFDGIKARRGAGTRIVISSLVTEIRKIYENLPPCSELVSVDEDDSADTYFVVM